MFSVCSRLFQVFSTSASDHLERLVSEMTYYGTKTLLTHS